MRSARGGKILREGGMTSEFRLQTVEKQKGQNGVAIVIESG
jgi:hypothetical protein